MPLLCDQSLFENMFDTLQWIIFGLFLIYIDSQISFYIDIFIKIALCFFFSLDGSANYFLFKFYEFGHGWLVGIKLKFFALFVRVISFDRRHGMLFNFINSASLRFKNCLLSYLFFATLLVKFYVKLAPGVVFVNISRWRCRTYIVRAVFFRSFI